MAVLTRRLRAESNKHELSWSQLAVTARLEMALPPQQNWRVLKRLNRSRWALLSAFWKKPGS